ncbi:MAG: cytochrome c3 family protein [Thermodesulfovibrionales bacterium]
MKSIAAVVVALALIAFAGSAVAVPAGKSVQYESSAGKVVFDGKAHADKGLKCNDCHPGIFQMKKGSSKITMEAINAGKLCGECHNGSKAFKAGDPANCARCHQK